MMNHLDKIFTPQEEKKQMAAFVPPTGTREEQGRELIRRCEERDKRLEKTALEAEREGDADGCWLAMAARAENKRVMDGIKSDVQAMAKTSINKQTN